jgi:hypothetical protein
MPRLFGKGTHVPEKQSTDEISAVASRYGAQHAGLVLEIGRAIFSCTHKRHRIRIIVPLPVGTTHKVEQERREIFRSMRQWILISLDAIERKFVTINVIWAAYVVRKGGKTLQEIEIEQSKQPLREPGDDRPPILLPPPDILQGKAGQGSMKDA